MNRIKLIQGDITKLDVDAIVNAANSTLLGGGGVDGAIHRAGGPQILEECKAIRNKQGGCDTGEAVVTSGGKLKAKYVVHTVGPVWKNGNSNEDNLLKNAYTNSLRLAVAKNCSTIAFPNISTGVYGFPKERAANIAIQTTKDFLASNDSLHQVIFCCFDDDNFSIYSKLLDL
jgi:O-acetyl-ADP-ribose deacetylase (regulator of RNase III)